MKDDNGIEKDSKFGRTPKTAHPPLRSVNVFASDSSKKEKNLKDVKKAQNSLFKVLFFFLRLVFYYLDRNKKCYLKKTSFLANTNFALFHLIYNKLFLL